MYVNTHKYNALALCTLLARWPTLFGWKDLILGKISLSPIREVSHLYIDWNSFFSVLIKMWMFFRSCLLPTARAPPIRLLFHRHLSVNNCIICIVCPVYHTAIYSSKQDEMHKMMTLLFYNQSLLWGKLLRCFACHRKDVMLEIFLYHSVLLLEDLKWPQGWVIKLFTANLASFLSEHHDTKQLMFSLTVYKCYWWWSLPALWAYLTIPLMIHWLFILSRTLIYN